MLLGTQVSVPNEAWIERRDYIRVFSGLIVLLIAVLVYFFPPQELWQSTLNLLNTIKQSGESTADKAISPQHEEKAKVVEATATVIPQEASVVPDGQIAPLPTVSDTVATATPSTLSSGVLKFSFAKPAWVEVRDRSGAIIFSQLSQAGSSREIEGQPPFSLVVGNASYVTLQYKDKDVDLSKRSKDEVARVTVE